MTVSTENRQKYPRSTKKQPGTWNYIRGRAGVSASFICPNCGQLGLLTDHTIDAEGVVNPSVICEGGELGCTFHEFIQLEDWNPAEDFKETLFED